MKNKVLKRLIQIAIGIAILVASVLIIIMASKGSTCEEQDIGAVFITIPMGLFLMFSKETIF